jgi:hypothetical protein
MIFEIRLYGLRSPSCFVVAILRRLGFGSDNLIGTKKLRDNPLSDRFIEVGTKALRRELMSGETLRAPRQQLRRLRASAFDLFRTSFGSRTDWMRAFVARFPFLGSRYQIPELAEG